MNDEVKRLKEARIKAWNTMSEVLKTASDASRAMTGEEVATFTAAEAELNAAGKDIEARERHEAAAKIMNAPAPTPGVPSGDAPIPGVDNREAEYDKAFSAYLHRGNHIHGEQRDRLEQGFTKIESRDMGEATGAVGGYLIPPGFLAKITEVQKWFGGVRAVANVIETASGQSLVWPVNDDTANPAVILGENTIVSEKDLAFTQKTLGAYMWNTGAVRIGRALMQDSAFDLESVLADRFAKRFGRGQNTVFTTGTGISGGLASVTASTVLTTVAAPWLSLATLLSIVHSVDPAYRQSGNCAFMMNDSTLSAVQSMADTAGRPLFIPAGTFGSIAQLSGPNGAVKSGQADTLLGFPIVINNDLPSFAATGSAKPIIFGDFRAGYIVRDVVGSAVVLRLEERYADYAEIGFIGYERSDGNTDDPNALNALANHA